MTEALVNWIEGGAINTWVLGSAWVWPILEILHFIGLSLLLGSIIVVDLRVAGLLRKLDTEAVLRLLPLAALGFAINMATGILFFFGDPGRYAINVGFQAKMILVLLAGLNALWFYVKVEPRVRSRDPAANAPPTTKFVAFSSLAIWLGVLLLGRLIPYVGTG